MSSPTKSIAELAYYFGDTPLVRVATALRIVSVVVVAKALLIGVVYWRRAEILGRPVHIGAGSWACLIAVVTIGVAIALTVCVAARHQNGDRTP